MKQVIGTDEMGWNCLLHDSATCQWVGRVKIDVKINALGTGGRVLRLVVPLLLCVDPIHW
ncbi:MAG: hypothetical protein HC773_31330 [Scytonema sp. CRU_2_7]|nr:hypothetical protein [Scytonema sp. CRU_2_7]